LGRDRSRRILFQRLRAAPFALFWKSRKTERGAGQFLVRLVVRAAPFALFWKSRKTERGAGQFLVRLVVRAAPFALFWKSRKTERGAGQAQLSDGLIFLASVG
jgi:hypothetical protein